MLIVPRIGEFNSVFCNFCKISHIFALWGFTIMFSEAAFGSLFCFQKWSGRGNDPTFYPMIAYEKKPSIEKGCILI
jgi:hypothetical protein